MAAKARGRRGQGIVVDASVAELVDLPAGPSLSAALARIALPSVNGHELVLVLRALNRQSNHDRGLLLQAAAEVMRRRDPEFGMSDDEPYEDIGAGAWVHPEGPADQAGAAEVRAALMLTRRAANTLCALAADLVVRLPAVLVAMISGWLDQPRARVFSSWTSELCPPHARAVVERLLPAAPTMTTSQLVEAIQKAAIELDPQWARRKYEAKLRGRRVEGHVHPDGTGELAGYQLPADQVAAACNRLDEIAGQVKAAGHPDALNVIRADIYLGLLDGSLAGLDEQRLLEHLIARIPRPSEPTSGEAEPGDEPVTGEGTDRTESTVDGSDVQADGDVQADSGVQAGDGVQAGGGETRAGTAPRGEGPSARAANGERDGSGVGPSGSPEAVPGGVGRRVRGRGLQLLAGLGTVCGVDERPGYLLGFGVLHAELARRITAARHARWHYVLADDNGQPLDVGLVRRRPTIAWHQGAAPGYRGVDVWLQFTRAELATLLDNPPPGWTPLLAELAHRVDHRRTGPPDGDPTARHPDTALRRWVTIRDKRCTFPGCRTPARHSELDHAREHAAGGPTTHDNLHAACGPDHDLKTTHRWRAARTTTGQTVWTSPLGHTYRTTAFEGPERSSPPMPVPTTPDQDIITGYRADTVDGWQNPTCLYIHHPIPRPRPAPEPVPAAVSAPTRGPASPADDPPPF